MNGTPAVITNVGLIAICSCFSFVLFHDWKKEQLHRYLVGWLVFGMASIFLAWTFLSCAVMIRNLKRLDATNVSEIQVAGRAIADPHELRKLTAGLNECHWFLPTRSRTFALGRTALEIRLKSGQSYRFFVANDYGKQAILIFTEPGKGVKLSRGYAGSQHLLDAMKELDPQF